MFWQELWNVVQPVVIYAVIAVLVVVLVFLAGFLFTLIKQNWGNFKPEHYELAIAIEAGAGMAVHAVEQMAKAGGVDLAERKNAAIHLAGQYIDSMIPGATVNETVLGAAIEAAVYAMNVHKPASE